MPHTKSNPLPLAIVGAIVLLLSYAVFLLDKSIVIDVAREDGPFEYGGAFCFAVSGILFGWLFLKSRPGNDLFVFKTGKNLFYLLLALLFIFAAGEEISWGQRIFNITPPESIASNNLQGEMNIHNLRLFHPRDETGAGKSGIWLMLTMERMFAMFWLGFCVCTPLAARFVAPLRSLITRINIPLVAIAIGLLFPFNYAITKVLERYMTGENGDLMWPLIEIKESTFAFLFMIVAIELVRRRGASPDAKPATDT